MFKGDPTFNYIMSLPKGCMMKIVTKRRKRGAPNPLEGLV